MKTGLGLYQKYRMVYAFYNLLLFFLRKKLLGFDVANQFLQRVDKISLQLILKKNGADIGRACNIETGLIFHNCRNYNNLIIGNNCHIGKNCFFDLRDTVTIGDNAVISMKVTIITHIDMSKSVLNKHYPTEKSPVKIGLNVYIGVNATILMGTELGENSFIAAGSIVNRNVEPYTIVGGIPAKIIKEIILE